ncbi:hypothetical protein [Phytomonospora endophytica]|uniref:Cell division protein FtsL n=1 Tax=Phytomonospora endophytica TaxID=714109 RepID=A0A841FLD2_9ACTN|nr:hypothetical protein [Phytomonospora endophytica]MBB6032760.1 hypothetical protein [Phytomonospora endophytica]GIG66091.1 hypothetical protein Pen01_23860 [Phytomonospora endophytica]
MSVNKKGTNLARADHDEIVKAARRRARAADSRRRALAGDASAPVTDGPLALQPRIIEPEVAPPAPAPVAPEPAAPKRKAPAKRPDTVAPPAPVTTPRTPFVVFLIGLVAAGIVGLLLLNTAISEDAFALHDLRAAQGELDAHEQQLKDELAELSSPGNLAAAAKRLGLVPAEEVTYIRLPDGRELTMPKPGGN